MRIEIQKKGKMSSVDRYRYLYKQKLNENQKLAAAGGKPSGGIMGFWNKKIGAKEGAGKRQMSGRAELALKQIAMRKANKEAKIMRRMVIVTPKNFHNGSINRKGQIYDVAGNMVGKVNTKNGRIAFFAGFAGGKYKPRSLMTELLITDSINQYSPYFINLRKMQAMQNGWNPETGTFGVSDTINIYGSSAHGSNHGSGNHQMDMHMPRAPMGNIHGSHEDGATSHGANAGVTSWGVMSNNAWGTFNDNVWGTMVDNVWGGTESNVWGGLGGNSLWGWKGVKVWGTGNGVNYLRGITKTLSAIFGIRLGGSNRSGSGSSGGGESRYARLLARAAGSSGRTGGSTPRSSGRAR